MKKVTKIIQILLVLSISIPLTNCIEVVRHIQKMNKQFDSRYGRGSFNDAIQGSNNVDKTSSLAPYYSRINKLYEENKITYSERNRRKSVLSRAYDNWKRGIISHNDYFEKCKTLSR